MSDGCQRCSMLDRLLNDERREHESTRKRLKRSQADAKELRRMVKELEALIADASAREPKAAEAIRRTRRDREMDGVCKAKRKSEQRRYDNRGRHV